MSQREALIIQAQTKAILTSIDETIKAIDGILQKEYPVIGAVGCASPPMDEEMRKISTDPPPCDPQEDSCGLPQYICNVCYAELLVEQHFTAHMMIHRVPPTSQDDLKKLADLSRSKSFIPLDVVVLSCDPTVSWLVYLLLLFHL